MNARIDKMDKRTRETISGNGRNGQLAERLAAQLRATANGDKFDVTTLYQYVLLAMEIVGNDSTLTNSDRRQVVIDAMLIAAFDVNLSDEQVATVERLTMDMIEKFWAVYRQRTAFRAKARAWFRQMCCCCC